MGKPHTSSNPLSSSGESPANLTSSPSIGAPASARGDIVLDAFLGSGTTLIAAERYNGGSIGGVIFLPFWVAAIRTLGFSNAATAISFAGGQSRQFRAVWQAARKNATVRATCGALSQADEQPGAAAVGQHGAHFGSLSRHPADGAVRQYVHHLPSATLLPQNIVQNIPLTGRRGDLGLYDPIATGGPDHRRDLEALAGVGVEIGDVGRDRVASKGIPHRCPLVRRQRGQAWSDHLPKDHFEIEGPADYRRYHVVSLPKWRRLAGLHDRHQPGVELFHRRRHLRRDGGSGQSERECDRGEHEPQQGAAIG